ncbi:MAG TPA: M20/M25/M40 family metallo-hydrolase [Kofleriaceae bacterium]|jgi:acetylornithine deacetylase/succinyl-diaminopimelate desuccinylase-like protein
MSVSSTPPGTQSFVPASAKLTSLAEDTRRICQTLLRQDTTNPPGNERICAEFLAKEMREVGLEPELLEGEPDRTNMVVRYRGTGKKPPILLTAHLDVVDADPSTWKYPPFSGDEHEGCLWGRGAVDMKHMAAMSAAIMRKLATTRTRLDRDVIFAAVADEEAGCDLGAKYLVENHRSKIEAEYAIGEVGGFSLHIGETTFYPVQVAEKGFVWMRARLTGEAGHGSMPRSDSVVTRLGEALTAVGRAALPIHPTKTLESFLETIRQHQPAFLKPLAKLATYPQILGRLTRIIPQSSFTRSISALTSNTASATIVRAGTKTNSIPGVAEFEIDGRTLPGQTDQDLVRELQAVLGPGVELEIMKSAPPVVTEPVESPLLDVIARQLARVEPDGVLLPYMIPGFTDGKYFTQMGARWYGFSPIKIERDSGIKFADMFHGKDERVPVAGLAWGAELLDSIVREIAGA